MRVAGRSRLEGGELSALPTRCWRTLLLAVVVYFFFIFEDKTLEAEEDIVEESN